MSALFDDLNFYITPDKFIIEPRGVNEQLVISRVSKDITVQARAYQSVESRATRRICGIIGTINLINGFNLIVATHREYVGQINGQVIWRLAGYDIIPYMSASHFLSVSQKSQNDTYLLMLHKMLDTPYFYFSYSYDLTHTLQRLHSMPPDFLQMGLNERAESRFVWNKFLLQPFQSQNLKSYCLPLIHGFVSINQLNINNNQFTLILVSRRSVQRAGVRLFSRGIDRNGYCSNFVETEQIVEFAGDRASFVQTRGSIPLFWAQSPNLQYKPKPTIDSLKNHMNMAAASKHLDTQMQLYGRQVLVNLIDHRGAEGSLETGFANIIAQINNSVVRYESFDFHSECRKMRWDRLNILIDRVAHEQDDFGWFHLRRDGTLLSSQDGVFRTNCVDCLDRTNVVQSMLAKRSLKMILTKLEILNAGQTIDSTATLSSLYKNVWADNADLVSIQYSGTGALKTDFTRTGKRTMQGALMDGYNSMVRYFKNNFADGFRQDSIDLFLGNYLVQGADEGSILPCPLQVTKGWKQRTFPSLLVFACAMFFSSAILPQVYNTENMLFLMFWGMAVGFTSRTIFRHGEEFVDWPKLVTFNQDP
ncbi:phosphatidylinositol-3-phosphatase SAC1 [Bradysia coprophila]|uniref:phosphatidylinositol-3-phosphatase SAC1 n=1 Tax=Bradysia coprophila TaxID=38358 RepID=UPI00187D951B|nr:phosphatidylinositol-3-phosphatase SAC1 [Bradysia coprophila]